MKRTSTKPAAILALTLLVLACGRTPEPVSLSYFYLPICPACPETAQMEAIGGELVGIARTHDHVSVEIHDLRRDEGALALREAADAAGVNAGTLAFPALFENGRVHEDFEQIDRYLATW